MGSISEYLDEANLAKLQALGNPSVVEQVERFLALCKPAKATVITDDEAEIDYVRRAALERGEEHPLALEGHTVHWDGYRDQARDKANTRVLVTPGMRMSKAINTIDRKEGLREVLGYLDGAMKGKECFVRFFALGPLQSRFTLLALQLTDSAYVAHSEDILYRTGYEEFKRRGAGAPFFTFVHSAGRLDERGNSLDVDKRRIYVDLLDNKVYSVNNQYAGNSLGLKKLALRLAIYKANHEDWLTEHMLIMGVHPPGKKRVTYFTGAYPSACGKTSTAMISGQTIVGDDIAYLRADEEGRCRAVNIEQGIFGIITDVNPVDDPVIYNALTTPREIIFSNVLVYKGRPYWLGMGLAEDEYPTEGRNHFGEWRKGVRDSDGVEVPLAHRNARYTIRLKELENVDPALDDPEGVVVRGILYGGRDSDTNVPICQALDWEHGVYMGATIESETTAATLGRTGVRVANPMAILDFMVVPLGRYLSNHLAFGAGLREPPKVFSTNYFLKHEGKYTNTKLDKKVWLLWAEGRVHGEYGALETPVGLIPRHRDLAGLFQEVFQRDYTWEEYETQFSIRVTKYLEKLARVEEFYKGEEVPPEFWRVHRRVKEGLEELAKVGEVVSPKYFE